MAQVMVFGAQVQVTDPAVPLGMYEQIPVDEFAEALVAAGYQGDEAVAAAGTALVEAGFNLPSSWVTVVRAELTGAGIAPGRVNGVTAQMQTLCIRLCGTEFGRVMGGSERTDAVIADGIMKAKHVPAAPVVRVDTGWSPTGQAWRAYVRNLAGWLGTADAALADSVRMIVRDYEVEPSVLPIVRGSIRDLALGSVLAGEHGVGEISRLAREETLESGSGLWLL
jgi:hypothetical protein